MEEKIQDQLIGNLSIYKNIDTDKLKTLEKALRSPSLAFFWKLLDEKIKEGKEDDFNMNVDDTKSMILRSNHKGFVMGIEWVKDLKHQIDDELEERTKEIIEEEVA
jgi:histone deacetylase complex regulatory component SIN3